MVKGGEREKKRLNDLLPNSEKQDMKNTVIITIEVADMRKMYN